MKALCLRCRAINTGLAEWCHDCGGRLAAQEAEFARPPVYKDVNTPSDSKRTAELEEKIGHLFSEREHLVSLLARTNAKLAPMANVMEAAKVQVRALFMDPPDADLQRQATQGLIDSVNALASAERA